MKRKEELQILIDQLVYDIQQMNGFTNIRAQKIVDRSRFLSEYLKEYNQK